MAYRIYVEPRDGIKPLIRVIDKSRHFVYINSYLLDDPRILEAVTNAVKRKADVRLMVDGRPYGINGDDGTHAEINDLKKTGAKVKIAPGRFEKPNVFDHAKYMVTEKFAEVGTPNFTEAGFSKNREYFTITRNRKIIDALKQIFLSDFQGKSAGEMPRKYLIVSPGSESALKEFILKERRIVVETEEMGDDGETLQALMEKGRKAKIIVPDTVSSTDAINLKLLKKHGVKVKYMPAGKLYMHAKMIAGSRAFIGSENFTKSSLNRNRETGIIINGYFAVSRLKNTFSSDWRKASRSIKGAKFHASKNRRKKSAKNSAK
jgi:cardiolipin synthase